MTHLFIELNVTKGNDDFTVPCLAKVNDSVTPWTYGMEVARTYYSDEGGDPYDGGRAFMHYDKLVFLNRVFAIEEAQYVALRDFISELPTKEIG